MRVVIALGVAASLACGQPPRAVETLEPQGILARAREQFRRGDYNQAIVAYRRLQFELIPGQPEIAEARYYVAECSFQTGDLAGAAVGFQKIAEEFPTSEYAPLALLRAGDANLRMWKKPEVDPTNGQAALATYQELVGRYPGTAAAGRAQLHIARLNEWFAEKSYQTGVFYMRRRAFDSAIIYFKDVIASYPNTHWVPLALLRLTDSYRAIGYNEELKETCANLRQYYPRTEGIDGHCPANASAGTP